MRSNFGCYDKGLLQCDALPGRLPSKRIRLGRAQADVSGLSRQSERCDGWMANKLFAKV